MFSPEPGNFLKNPPGSREFPPALLKSAGNRCKNCDALYNKKQSGKKATVPGAKQRLAPLPPKNGSAPLLTVIKGDLYEIQMQDLRLRLRS
ncbi:MAG: hypothetical protein II922_06800 [Succinimonas sp.]|nr:hypothetical protein [Succinimonas sp.]